MASVEGSIRAMVPGPEPADSMCATVLGKLDEWWGQRLIQMKTDGLSIIVHQLELDKHVPIVKLLIECHSHLSQDTRESSLYVAGKIAHLFVDPASMN